MRKIALTLIISITYSFSGSTNNSTGDIRPKPVIKPKTEMKVVDTLLNKPIPKLILQDEELMHKIEVIHVKYRLIKEQQEKIKQQTAELSK